jgi:hypothetical protein
VSGDKIVADIGRGLWMSSQHDSNDFKSTQNRTEQNSTVAASLSAA